MEDRITYYQRMGKRFPDKFSLAEGYFRILSVLNGLELTEREVQLVAYTAIKGNMNYVNVKEDFCKRHNTSSATISNIIMKMKRKGLMVKDKGSGKIRINPVIGINFERGMLVLDIRMSIVEDEKGSENTSV